MLLRLLLCLLLFPAMANAAPTQVRAHLKWQALGRASESDLAQPGLFLARLVGLCA